MGCDCGALTSRSENQPESQEFVMPEGSLTIAKGIRALMKQMSYGVPTLLPRLWLTDYRMRVLILVEFEAFTNSITASTSLGM